MSGVVAVEDAGEMGVMITPGLTRIDLSLRSERGEVGGTGVADIVDGVRGGESFCAKKRRSLFDEACRSLQDFWRRAGGGRGGLRERAVGCVLSRGWAFVGGALAKAPALTTAPLAYSVEQ